MVALHTAASKEERSRIAKEMATKRKLVTTTCRYCGREIIGLAGRKQYCSQKCRNAVSNSKRGSAATHRPKALFVTSAAAVGLPGQQPDPRLPPTPEAFTDHLLLGIVSGVRTIVDQYQFPAEVRKQILEELEGITLASADALCRVRASRLRNTGK